MSKQRSKIDCENCIFFSFITCSKNKQLKEKDEEIGRYREGEIYYKREIDRRDNKIKNQRQQLKQSQNQKAIEVLNKIRNYDTNTNKQKIFYTKYVIGLNNFLDQLQKELESD